MDPLTLDETPESQASSWYVFLLTLVAAMGGLLFGYDTAVIAAANEYLQVRFDLSEALQGWAAGSALVGCMIGASLAGFVSDRFGRKKAMVLSAVLFLVSAVGAAVPRNLVEFVIARILGGVGIGIASLICPLYISEVSPARVRGRLVSLNQFAIVFGMFVVYFVNAKVSALGDFQWNVAVGWRWMFAMGVVPALIFFGFVGTLPESPRWLMKRGRKDAATAILARVGGAEHARREVGEIADALAHERQESLGQLLDPAMRRPLIIGIGLAILQQITGINIVMYFAPKIFSSAGAETQQAIDSTVAVGVVNILFTLVAIGIVDRVGRKPLLLIASAGMGLSLALLGWAFTFQEHPGRAVLIFVLSYVAFFAVAMGPVVWVVIAEVFPTRIRGRAMSVAIVCLWIACFAVTMLFPIMLKTLQGGSFFVYATICALTFVFIAVAVPETKGKSLEEIERQWFRSTELRKQDNA